MFRNKFNPTILAVVLIALLCFFLPDIQAQIIKENKMQDTTYTVKWTLVEVLPAPCPDKQKENEYGITNNYGISCAVLHLRTETTEKQKEFNTEKEADEFIKKMPLQKDMSMALGSYCENAIKIKNIKEKQGKK
jgi:hypothetical protein